MTQLMKARQVAARLQVTVEWFYRNRAQLEAADFPRPLPGFKQGRWSAEAIEDWISRGSAGDQAEPPEPEPQSIEDLQERLRATLETRGRKIAARVHAKRGAAGRA